MFTIKRLAGFLPRSFECREGKTSTSEPIRIGGGQCAQIVNLAGLETPLDRLIDQVGINQGAIASDANYNISLGLPGCAHVAVEHVRLTPQMAEVTQLTDMIGQRLITWIVGGCDHNLVQLAGPRQALRQQELDHGEATNWLHYACLADGLSPCGPEQ